MGNLPFDIIVEGQNDPSVDVINLQSAVNSYQRILIRGKFDFGKVDSEPYHFVEVQEKTSINGPTLVPAKGTLEDSRNEQFWENTPETVFFSNNCEIYGEEAEIIGGYRPFTVGITKRNFVFDINVDDGHLDTSIDYLDQFPISPCSVTIKNITFRQNLHCAIWLASTRNHTEICDNKFVNPIPLIERYWFGSIRAFGIYSQLGLGSLHLGSYINTEISDMRSVLPRSDGNDSKTGSPLQGSIFIDNNKFTSTVGGLIYLLGCAGDITVTNNTTKGGGIAIFGYHGHMLIENNNIDSSRPIRNTVRISEDSFGRNHPLTINADRTWAEGDWEKAKTSIRHNTIKSGGGHPLEIMISKNVEINNNRIICQKIDNVWSAAISLWKAHDCKIIDNTITGSSEFAFALAESSSNKISGTDFDQFNLVEVLNNLPTSLITLFASSRNEIKGEEISYIKLDTSQNSIDNGIKIDIDGFTKEFQEKLQNMQLNTNE